MGLFKHISDYALRLNSAAKWNKTQEALDHVFNKGQDDEGDYIYEFYVLMFILNNLSANYSLVYVPDPKNTHVFPKGHALKENYPYFKAFDLAGTELRFQICPGSKVTNKYDHNVHPDISFQKPNAGLTPASKDLILIVDAKHKSKSDQRVTTDDVKVFAIDLQNFEIDTEGHTIEFEPPLDAIDKSAIVTNGQKHLDSDGMLAEEGFILMYNFYPDKTHSVMR